MLVCNVCFGINEKEFIRFAVYHPELSQLDRRSVTDRLCNCFGSFEAHCRLMMLTAGRALADADGDGNLTQGNLTQGTRALSDHEERSLSEAAVVGIVAACSTVVALTPEATPHRPPECSPRGPSACLAPSCLRRSASAAAAPSSCPSPATPSSPGALYASCCAGNAVRSYLPRLWPDQVRNQGISSEPSVSFIGLLL